MNRASPNVVRMRIAKYLAAAGLGSRRHCETLVGEGRVTVNGAVVASPAFDVVPGRDTVCCDARPVQLATGVYVLLNKPPGYTCSARDRHAQRLVFDLIPKPLGRLFTVGRLDRDSEGLLLLTNDGDLAQRLAHPRYGVQKRYRVWCAGVVDRKALDAMRHGVEDDGDVLRVRAVRVLEAGAGEVVFDMVLDEGRKREIRRLCLRLGLRVHRLRREEFGPLRDAGLAPGCWRHVTPEELASLRHAARLA